MSGRLHERSISRAPGLHHATLHQATYLHLQKYGPSQHRLLPNFQSSKSTDTHHQRRDQSSKKRPTLAGIVLHYHQSQSRRARELILLQLNHLLQHHQATAAAPITSAPSSSAASDMDNPGAVDIAWNSRDENEKFTKLDSVNLLSTEPKTVQRQFSFRLDHCGGFPEALYILFLHISRSC